MNVSCNLDSQEVKQILEQADRQLSRELAFTMTSAKISRARRNRFQGSSACKLILQLL